MTDLLADVVHEFLYTLWVFTLHLKEVSPHSTGQHPVVT